MKVPIEPKNDRSNTPTLEDYREQGEYISRKNEKAIINEHSHASITLRENGQINISAGPYSQYKLNPSGMNTEYSMESGLIANRRNISVDEIVINDHKFNNQIFEYSDMKSIKLPGSEVPYIIGDLMLSGTVLVKAWEPNLKRYMLIRRPALMRMFSPKLNLPEIHGALGINDPLKISESIYAYDTAKGYQTNIAATDGKTYIKDTDGDGFVDPGEDRSGIDRNHQIIIGNGNGGTGGGSAGGGAGGNKVFGPASGKGAENIPASSPTNLRSIALTASQESGLPADWLWAQIAHESALGESTLAKEDHNYGGMTIPCKYASGGAGGQPDGNGVYAHFDSDEMYAKSYGHYLTLYKDNGIFDAKTLDDFVLALKKGGYMGADPYEYINNMKSLLGSNGTKL